MTLAEILILRVGPLVLLLVVWWLCYRWDKRRKAKWATEIAQAMVKQRPLEGLWQAMPGQRLELGGTGFWIGFFPANDVECQMILFSPEGTRIAYGAEHLLSMLKEHAEIRAAARMEFDAPQGAQPWRKS
jgi:hypothetical protein